MIVKGIDTREGRKKFIAETETGVYVCVKNGAILTLFVGQGVYMTLQTEKGTTVHVETFNADGDMMGGYIKERGEDEDE